MYWQCKSTIFSRLWRVGCRWVVLGCRKHFGCPQTQLANFVNFVDFSSARFVYMRASTHSLSRKIRLNINFQCLEIIPHSILFSSIINPFGNSRSYDCIRPTGNGPLQPLFRPTNR